MTAPAPEGAAAPAVPNIPVLNFDGRYGIAISENTLLIYALPTRQLPGEPVEPGFVRTGTLVCAWHFTAPASLFVLMQALAGIGTRHKADELWLAVPPEAAP